MSENVFTLPGITIQDPTPREPVPQLVAVLEEMLALAKAGKIVGLAMAAVEQQGDGSWEALASVSWEACDPPQIVFAAARLQFVIQHEVVGPSLEGR